MQRGVNLRDVKHVITKTKGRRPCLQFIAHISRQSLKYVCYYLPLALAVHVSM